MQLRFLTLLLLDLICMSFKQSLHLNFSTVISPSVICFQSGMPGMSLWFSLGFKANQYLRSKLL